uniref:TSA: Wollemia nobilis Ref_Wollemi_Transcript_26238_1798 transcribed RNA sequence n=1 Tax=Wollemia nobilis TaxID=56998 RepID=A0A0C9S179_9CONI
MVPPVSVTGQSSHSSVQFLNNVLSQRGPSALPYEEDVKWLIRQHLVSVIQEFPSLQAKTAVFSHNDGRTVNLLQAEGTVPMYYQEVMYNIPVIIWLLESYPRQAPCVYVTPTRDMIIKRGHPHVNASGMVSIHYLQAWVFPSSNLVDLVRNLSLLFGQDPPLYTKQSVPQARPSPPPTAQMNMNPIHSAHMASSSSPIGQGGNLVRPPGPPRGYPYNHRLPPSPQRPPHMEDPAEVFKRNAINKLVETLHADMAELRKTTEVEMDGLFNTQAVLRQREEQLDKGLREMQEEKEGLEQQLQLILTNTDVLETWLRNNEDKKKADIDIDDVFEPCDGLSKQILECTAADLAIEDILYSLDKAVQEGTIPVDAYLKNIRALSREQFFHRATAAKVRAAQMQSQVATMAARASYVS